MFVATGIGPYSGQSVHFQHAAPPGLDYAVNRYRREADRHYRVLDGHLAGRTVIVGEDYTIVDMADWGWIRMAKRVFATKDVPLDQHPHLQRWFRAVDARPSVPRALAVGQGHSFKQEIDEDARRALLPSNFPETTP